MINAKLLQLVINASHDGIAVAEKEGDDNILIYINPAFERLTGYSSAESLYKDCRFLQQGDRDETTLERIRTALAEGLPCRERIRNYRKDGSMFWNELSISPVYNEGDGRTYFIGVQKDVSAQVAAEQRIRVLEAELAQARATVERLKSDQR